MRKKMVLLTLAAAMVMSMGLTGCATTRDNVTTKSNNMRTRTTHDGIYPLGMNPNLDTNANKYNGNRYGTRGYGVDGVRGYGVDGIGTRGYGVGGTGTRGLGVDGIGTRGYGVDGIGTRGWGVDGAGTRGYGVDGMGTRGYGVGGTGTRGYGVDGMYGTHRYGTHGYGTHNYGMTGYGVDGSRLHGYGTGTHSMTNMHMNKKIADKIARMKGVKSANVMLTNNNAYVAVSTDTAMKTKGTGKGTHHLKAKGTHHRGTGAKSISSRGGTGNLDARSKSHTLNNSVDMRTSSDISADLKNRIAEIVKKDAPQCQQVYVSSNPDFVKRMNEFMKSSKEGRPLSGFANDFQEMVYRIFPTQEYGTTRQMTNTHPRRLNNMAPGLR
ncbi:YhcN/YlaJ family sporulation lipoprotein [Paenibacillus dendritiformis]|uniref:YhcN/YlaJ family sporulation lipoprotein n=1 Tax=Paenibacillus dendritiformis TaxID=130049 RepID=UPI00155F8B6F|nr:YhcN/YlaJ family sporulation lipoprotein [Paenibacillus dendritiformis]NRF98436.1 YhcN/YlaJ family sporulation lipoprotein [Paenibacillus dendritiformis]